MNSKIITVLGSKHGCGQSLVAVNIAIGLAKKIQKPVALLDFSQGKVSAIDTMLGISDAKSLADLLPIIVFLH